MVYTIEELKEKITPIAIKYRLPAVYVFGSYARGEANENSDVDLLIRRQGSNLQGWQLGALYEDLREGLQKGIDLVTIEAIETADERERSPWFIDYVKNDRLTIYENN